MNILQTVRDFNGLNALSKDEIDQLCSELRELIISVTLKNGGHLASSLGTVELTVALLKVFNPDYNKIIFDVGHQAYAYKILTKRLNEFKTLRKKSGIAGFPRMQVSPYDFFTTGHSSTSISAAMGYAKARDLKQESHEVIAVIGDGALINGVAFEALNCIESTKSKVIIVLNDNKMSINSRIGGMASHLAHLAVNPAYKKIKNFIKQHSRNSTKPISLENRIGKIKNKLKSLLLPTNIFEEMDISYWGPFNGHNVSELEEAFELAKKYEKSLILHVITQKGKGNQITEEFPDYYHGVDANSSLIRPSFLTKPSKISWSSAMEKSLTALAQTDPRIVVCTAAMKEGTKLGNFANNYPERFFDVGISEEHLLIFAAGMAAGGLKPAICIYSTFLQRAADQVVHDICIPKLPVLIGIDRAGLVGADGETHHGVLDVSWLRAIPELTFVAPRDIADLNFFVAKWINLNRPIVIRYPRGTAQELLCRKNSQSVEEWGMAEILVKGDSICLIGIGSTIPLLLDAQEILASTYNINVTLVDLRFIKPIDFFTIDKILSKHNLIITAVESFLIGGIGEAIASYVNRNGYNCKVLSIGVPDKFIAQAPIKDQFEESGLTVKNIIEICINHNG